MSACYTGEKTIYRDLTHCDLGKSGRRLEEQMGVDNRLEDPT